MPPRREAATPTSSGFESSVVTLEDGDHDLGPSSLWPTRIRQRMGVGWEARVLM